LRKSSGNIHLFGYSRLIAETLNVADLASQQVGDIHPDDAGNEP
jgi:hypothetical protein